MVESGDVERVHIERMATGGEAIAHLSDGRVVFVTGALPDEVVDVRIERIKKRWARATTLAVIESSPDRAPLLCDHALAGECGGCDWLHVAPAAARTHKLGIVTEQLARLGGLDAPRVRERDHAAGRRTTTRCSIVEGRAGYRSRRSSDRFAAEQCQALHPALEELVVEGRFDGVDEVTLRVGIDTGERLALLHPHEGATPSASLPPDVRVVDAREPGDAAFTTRVAGLDWRVSAASFFQTSDSGVEALVAAVAAGLSGAEGPVVDLYAGVGLLGIAAAGDRLTHAVESATSAVADARSNAAQHLSPSVDVIECRVERWTPSAPASTVIADPARAGLGADGVAVVDATHADRLVLVSCDPASLGRDAGLLREGGWRHAGSEVIDMFPDTSRIEIVSVFGR